MNDLISVIVPVYNVEKFLPRCIESLQAQIYENIQIILVDDGSTDGSGKICREYADRDDRIHLIRQENAGAPAARNRALRMAQGKYVYFMDSDDWAEPTMLEDMYKLAEENEGKSPSQSKPGTQVYELLEALRMYF